MYEEMMQEIRLLHKEQVQTMEDFHIPRDTIRLFNNRLSRMSNEEKLLVLQAHNPFNPSDCMDVANEL